MSSNEIETNNVNGSRLAEQGPSCGRCSRQGNIGHHVNPVISKRRKWTSQENKIAMECYLLTKPKIKGYIKRMLSLWLQKVMFWVSEQRLVDQANTIRKNSWMTKLEIEELERKVTGSDSVIVEEARSVEALPDHVGENMGVEEQADSMDEEEVAIVMEIAEVIERGRKDKLPVLRNVPKKKLLEETPKVDKVLSKFKTHSITKTNELFYAGAAVVTNRLGVKIEKVVWRKEPMRERLQNKIKGLRKDSSQPEAKKVKDISNLRHWERLQRKYSIRVKRLNVVIEELKQRITAITAKVRRYQGRVDSYRQNRLFENNQRQFYRELDREEERCDDDDQPVAEELKQFWGNIWSKSADHKKDAKWLQDLRSEVNVKKQEKIDITKGSMKRILGRMSNWKSPGPDLV